MKDLLRSMGLSDRVIELGERYETELKPRFEELDRIAEESKMEKDKLKEYIGDDEYGKNQIIEDVKIQKAIDLIVENAKEI